MAKQPVVKFKKLHEDAITPTYAHKTDACADLYSVEKVVIPAKGRKVVNTGIAIELPHGYEAQVRPRSGLAAKKGITILNSPGTIDEGYRGEVKVILYNTSNNIVVLEKGTRIAQICFQKVSKVKFEETKNLSDSDRGEGGLGSTGE